MADVLQATWVDDCYFKGNKSALSSAIEEFKRHFKVTATVDTSDYLSYKIHPPKW